MTIESPEHAVSSATDPAPTALGSPVPLPEAAGRTSWFRPPTNYELFLQSEGVPVYRGVDGVRDVRELRLDRWDRLDCTGAYIQLRGLGGLQGMAVLGIAPHGRVAPERHLYEETFYVVEGSGSTRIWTDDDATGATFSW